MTPQVPPKWSKKAQNGQKSYFSPHLHGYLPKIKKSIKKVAGVVEIDLNNSALVLMGHIWFRWCLRYRKSGQKLPKMIKNHLFHHTHMVTPKLKKNIKCMAKVVQLDFINSISPLYGHIWFSWLLRYPKNGQKRSIMIKNHIFHHIQYVNLHK